MRLALQVGLIALAIAIPAGSALAECTARVYTDHRDREDQFFFVVSNRCTFPVTANITVKPVGSNPTINIERHGNACGETKISATFYVQLTEIGEITLDYGKGDRSRVCTLYKPLKK